MKFNITLEDKDLVDFREYLDKKDYKEFLGDNNE